MTVSLPLNPLNDPNPIVTVQVSTVMGPVPNNYQQTGAIISRGGTNMAPQQIALLTEYSDLAPLLFPGGAISAITWALGVVTVTTVAPHGLTSGVSYMIDVEGCAPVAYNGIHSCTITGTSSFTFPLVTNPGAETTLGTWTSYRATLLSYSVRSFFNQGRGQSVYVLELGAGITNADEIDALQTWIDNNPLSFYGYLVPVQWDGVHADYIPFLEGFQNNEAMTYFWTTTTTSTYQYYANVGKCVVLMIESPNAPATEDAAAAAFFWGLQFKATAITRVSPFCYKYVYGITPYPVKNNGPLLKTLKANNVNYIRTGAEGGIAKTMIYPGTTADGNDYFNWWWTIDWVQINVNLNLSNAIINGSNNPLAPLYYDQPGINRLLAVNAQTMSSASEFGMVNGQVVQTEYNTSKLTAAIAAGEFTAKCDCNAVPFIDYSVAAPGDYATGEYDGLSILFIPARGFVHVLVSVVASQLVTV